MSFIHFNQFNRFPLIEPRTDGDWAFYFGIFSLIFANLTGFCIYEVAKTLNVVAIVFLTLSIFGFLVNTLFMISKIIKIRRSSDPTYFNVDNSDEDIVGHHPL